MDRVITMFPNGVGPQEFTLTGPLIISEEDEMDAGVGSFGKSTQHNSETRVVAVLPDVA